ncbi:MAG: hypothetical protein AB1664_07015 [Thermodesulfobacteriota bacterium]
MSDNHRRNWLDICFPRSRFDPSFPLAFWFAGLWFYLKSFLYLCYVYMLGLDPPPYPTGLLVETVYFAAAFVPCFLLGLALWHGKRWVVVPAIFFFLIDTPLLTYHVLRLAATGGLESGLTRFLEYGGLVLNLIALGWLGRFKLELGTRNPAR